MQNEIANAAEEARRVISNAAAEALRVINATTLGGGGDHDLIIRLDTKMDDLKADIKELKDGTAIKIDKHEERLGIAENKITKIMTWGSAGLFLLGILEFLINKFLK